ncbi:MAG: stage II sporulation protein M [Polyangiaceae bacterium]
MKTRDDFVAQRGPRWSELEGLLDEPSTAKQGDAVRRLAALYRELCADLMRARALGFGPDVQRQLDALAARSHNFLYRSPRRHGSAAVRAILVEFPRTARGNWPFVLCSALLFWLPFAIGVVGALSSTSFAEHVLSARELEQAARSFSHGFDGRAEGVDATMAGFYVYNNIGIAFRCFATGVLFGAGSVFFLVYNGLNIGTVLGHLERLGHGRNLLTFVSGHSAFELGAVVISGAAGLLIGYSLLDTRGLTRVASLRSAGKPAITLVLGAACMLAIAAGVEAFWSPSGVAAPVKWLVGVLNGVALLAFFVFAGRTSQRSRAA